MYVLSYIIVMRPQVNGTALVSALVARGLPFVLYVGLLFLQRTHLSLQLREPTVGTNRQHPLTIHV